MMLFLLKFMSTNYYNGCSPLHEIAVSCESVTKLRNEVTTLLNRLDILITALSPVPQNAFPYFKLTYYPSRCILWS